MKGIQNFQLSYIQICNPKCPLQTFLHTFHCLIMSLISLKQNYCPQLYVQNKSECCDTRLVSSISYLAIDNLSDKLISLSFLMIYKYLIITDFLYQYVCCFVRHFCVGLSNQFYFIYFLFYFYFFFK